MMLKRVQLFSIQTKHNDVQQKSNISFWTLPIKFIVRYHLFIPIHHLLVLSIVRSMKRKVNCFANIYCEDDCFSFQSSGSRRIMKGAYNDELKLVDFDATDVNGDIFIDEYKLSN